LPQRAAIRFCRLKKGIAEIACNKLILLNGCELKSLMHERRPVLLKVDVEGAEPEVTGKR
jgi:hypothetical protein